MKKYMTKPVLAIAAAVTIAGGLTPLWADASSLSASSSTKVVMNEEGKQVTRYNLKELEENNPTTLNWLLEKHMDHLYIVVKDGDKVILDAKMSTFIRQREEEWDKIYRDHYEDIYLELRFEGFISVKPETKDGKTYLSGEVTDDVTKVEVIVPNGQTIQVTPTANNSFTISFPAITSSLPKYATLKAYVDTELVETKKVRVNVAAAVKENAIVSARAVYNESEKEVKANGIVSLNADKVYVTYNGKKQEADVKKFWKGTGLFAVTFKDVAADSKKQVLVEAYKNGVKIDAETIAVVSTGNDDQPQAYSIKGTATLNAKQKLVQVKGTITGVEKADKAKLFVVVPDGKKYEAKLSPNGEFSANVSYKNRSLSAKAVRVELYVDGKLVAQSNIQHGTPVKADGKAEGKEKEKHRGKGHAYGHEKGAKKEHKWKKDDDHDRDEDDHDDDRHDDGEREGDDD
jgi:hypothetical protein